MKTSRQQVFEVIRSQKSVTAADLSRILTMTQANARHHLAVLEELGIIEVIGQRRLAGKGRSAKVFGLSAIIRGNNLALLARALLAENPASDTSLYQRLANRLLVNEIPKREGKKASMTTQLMNAVDHLNQMNYASRWEAWTDGPHIVFSQCPYRDVIDHFPELCQMDAALLQELMIRPVEQLSKLSLDQQGGRTCIFRITRTKT